MLGQSEDTQGLTWIVQATSKPSHWIYTTDQGDLLISEHNIKRSQPQTREGAPVASARTMQHLTRPQSKVTNTEKATSSGTDPWLQQDPWCNVKSPMPMGQMQMQEIADNVQKKVLEKIHEIAPTSNDANMEDEVQQKVHSLEEQVATLQSNFQQMANTVATNHQQQCQQNIQVNNKLMAVQQQQTGLQNVIENKLEEQMRRIEALLNDPENKRAKHGNENAKE